jgi:hypothetical protein
MKSLFLTLFFLSFISRFGFGQSSPLDTGITIDISNIPLNQDNAVVAISRVNANNIVIGASSDYDDMDANGMPVYLSTNKGVSWSSSRLPLPLNTDYYVWGEPSVTSDDAGNYYYAYILNDGSDPADSAGVINIAVSSNGGSNWQNATPLNIAIPNYSAPDGASITVDNSSLSPHHGRVYVVWDQFFANPDSEKTNGGVYIAWSDNKGASWKGMNFIGTSDDYQQVRTGKNGEIYVTLSDSTGNGHEFFLSVDGGSTFTAQLTKRFESYPTYVIDTEFTLLKGISGIAAFPYVAFDVDLTSNRIHLVYGDYQADIATLYYVFSDNNGTDWSAAEGIQELSSSDRFDPWVSVDQKTHESYVTFYSSDSDPANNQVAPYRIRVRDTAQQMMSPAFNPFSVEKTDSTSPYIGDHTSSDTFDSLYVGVWTQNRPGYSDGDVFAFISSQNPSKQAVEPIVIHSPGAWMSAPYPNPSQGNSVALRYYIPHATELRFDLFDVGGVFIKHLLEKSLEEGSYSDELDIRNIPPGTYIIRMMTDSGELSRKLILK